MWNAPATFQRMINHVIVGLEGVAAYLDGVTVFCQTWEGHIFHLCTYLQRLKKANLTVNLMKSELCHAKVTFLCHVVGQDQVQCSSSLFKD